MFEIFYNEIKGKQLQNNKLYTQRAPRWLFVGFGPSLFGLILNVTSSEKPYPMTYSAVAPLLSPRSPLYLLFRHPHFVRSIIPF